MAAGKLRLVDLRSRTRLVDGPRLIDLGSRPRLVDLRWRDLYICVKSDVSVLVAIVFNHTFLLRNIMAVYVY